MGWVTTRDGRLCCDICGEAGARRQRCPHGYCPSIACCGAEACKAKLKAYRAETCRVKCKVNHERFVAHGEERKRLLADGRMVRCAAVSDGHGVKVWFESATGRDHMRWMHHATYDAHPLMDNVILEQYEAVGIVVLTLDELPKEGACALV